MYRAGSNDAESDADRLNAAAAARFLGMTPECVRIYWKHCFYLPEGYLPYESRKRPGRPGMTENVSSRADLKRLQRAMRMQREAGAVKGDWKTAAEVADALGVDNVDDRMQLFEILPGWAEAGAFIKQRAVVDCGQAGRGKGEHRRKYRRVTRYNVAEVRRFLNEKPVMEVVADFRPVTPDVELPGMNSEQDKPSLPAIEAGNGDEGD